MKNNKEEKAIKKTQKAKKQKHSNLVVKIMKKF